MTRLVSKIYAMGAPTPETAQEREDRSQAARRAIWHQHGLAVFDPEDFHNDWDRQFIISRAEERYGRRGRHG